MRSLWPADGVRITTPDVGEESAVVEICTSVRNLMRKKEKITVETTLLCDGIFARINLHYTIVQLRRVRTPQFRLKQCDPLTDLLLCLHKHGHAHFIHTHHGEDLCGRRAFG